MSYNELSGVRRREFELNESEQLKDKITILEKELSEIKEIYKLQSDLIHILEGVTSYQMCDQNDKDVVIRCVDLIKSFKNQFIKDIPKAKQEGAE